MSIFSTSIFTAMLFYMFDIPLSLQLNPNYGLYSSSEMSVFMVYMLFFVSLISCLEMKMESSNMKLFCVFLIVLTSYSVFATSNLLLLFFAFETSLIPISFIILKWGKYPERSNGVLLLMTYTLSFSLPFLGVLLYQFNTLGAWSFLILENSDMPLPGMLMSFLSFSTFAVKLPLYGLHVWLPVAHVEAPTFGSMILAGILLKLGGVGLLKIKFMYSLNMLYQMESYFIWSYLLASILCWAQSDFKKLVAYSSIFHMGMLPLLLLSHSSISDGATILIMTLHGLISPLSFLLVGICYNIYSTRQLVLIRGVMQAFPMLAMYSALTFAATLPTPPFSGFIGELMAFISIALSNKSLLIALGFGAFMSLIFNMSWLLPLLSPNFMHKSEYYLSINIQMIFFTSLSLSFALFLFLNLL